MQQPLAKRDGKVACAFRRTFDGASINPQRDLEVLRFGFIHASGFVAPAELAVCLFPGAVVGEDFVVTIEDASSPEGIPYDRNAVAVGARVLDPEESLAGTVK